MKQNNSILGSYASWINLVLHLVMAHGSQSDDVHYAIQNSMQDKIRQTTETNK